MRKQVILIISIAISIFCCTTTHSKEEADISKFKSYIISHADKCNIYIYRDWANNKDSRKYIFDQNDISTIVNFISEKQTDLLKCGYTGEIDFLKDNKSILSDRIHFNTDCGNIVFTFNDNLYSQALTFKGIEFILNLKNI